MEEILKKHGYILSEIPYEYLDDVLVSVTYVKKGTQDYVVLGYDDGGDLNSALISSPIVNSKGYVDGSKEGIILVKNTNPYHRHSLELFEFCLGLQGSDNLSHEKRILKEHLKNLEILEPIIEVLKECDYKITESTIFDLSESDKRDSSDLDICLGHENSADLIVFSTDCLTGELKAYPEGLEKTFGKTKEEVLEILKEVIFQEDSLSFGYLLGNPGETINTKEETRKLLDALRWGEKSGNEVEDENIISEKYKYLLPKYRALPYRKKED